MNSIREFFNNLSSHQMAEAAASATLYTGLPLTTKKEHQTTLNLSAKTLGWLAHTHKVEGLTVKPIANNLIHSFLIALFQA